MEKCGTDNVDVVIQVHLEVNWKDLTVRSNRKRIFILGHVVVAKV
jgi:hypothetical protein